MEKLRVVIADDEALIRLDVKEILTEAGHSVVGEAADGKEAVLLVRKLKPDIVIMDVKMPVFDGVSAAKLITEEQLAPVVLLTAYSQDDIVKKADEAGVMAYLVKPVREEQLFPAMGIALTRFIAMQRLSQKLTETIKDLENRDRELDEALEKVETMRLVSKAKGILMAVHHLTEAQAYRRMQLYCMNKRITIRQLAEAVIAADEKNRRKNGK